MKTESPPIERMNVRLASHYGMCFGVRDAIEATESASQKGESITILGQLVHNPVVDDKLRKLGVKRGNLSGQDTPSEGSVVITAHGASDKQRDKWRQTGLNVLDTTCPLVRKAHDSLGALVNAGYHPVVIGKAGHVEVEGLVGDFPDAFIIGSNKDIKYLPPLDKIGIVSQTTQPVDHVNQLVEAIRVARPDSDVKFIDTVCAPTKNRQTALRELCAECEMVVVVGGANSNNTGELVRTAKRLGANAVQVERAADLDPDWFIGIKEVGVTAGTSTLDQTVREVAARLREIAVSQAVRS